MIELRDKLSDQLIEMHPLPVGKRLIDWLADEIDDFEVRERPPISITLNGNMLLQRRWDHQVRGSDKIVIYPEPKAAVGAILLKAVITAAVSYVVSALTTPTNNYNSTIPESSSIYSPNAQGNSARLNGVIPQIFGRHKYYPDTISAPWRIYEDDEQYLMLLLGCGVGRYDFESINIGNTSIDNYADDIDYQIFQPGEDVTGHPAHRHIYTSNEVGATSTGGMELTSEAYSLNGVNAPAGLQYQITPPNRIRSQEWVRHDHDDYRWESYDLPYELGDYLQITGSDNIDGVYSVRWEGYADMRLNNEDGSNASFAGGDDYDRFTIKGIDINGDTDILGPFAACPASETTELLILDFYHPGGLADASSGSLVSKAITVEISWREVGTNAWTTETFTKTAKTLDDVGYSYELPLPSAIRPEVKVVRTSDQSDDSNIRDTIQWTALRSELTAVSSYDDMTVMAVKIRGTNALSGSAENQFNTVQSRKLPVYSGGAWSAEQLTRDIAPVFSYIIKDCGHSDSQLNLEVLDQLHTLWQSRTDEFNGVFDTDSTLFPSLERVLAVGYSRPTISNGQIDIIRTQPRAAWGQFFSPDNTISITETGTLFDPDEPDGVTVEYFDADTWQTTTVPYLLPDDAGIFPEEVRAFGVTDRTKAWRYAGRARRERRYIRQLFEVETELEGLNLEIGDKCSLPGRSYQSGMVMSYNSSSKLLTLSEAIENSSADQFIIVRKPDGTHSGLLPVTYVSDHSVQLAAALDFTPDFTGTIDPPLFKFGIESDLCIPAVVRSIEPQGDTVLVELAVYDERLWADDDEDLPTYALA